MIYANDANLDQLSRFKALQTRFLREAAIYAACIFLMTFLLETVTGGMVLSVLLWCAVIIGGVLIVVFCGYARRQGDPAAGYRQLRRLQNRMRFGVSALLMAVVLVAVVDMLFDASEGRSGALVIMPIIAVLSAAVIVTIYIIRELNLND